METTTLGSINQVDIKTLSYLNINAKPLPKPQPDTAKEWYTKEMTCCHCGNKSTSRQVVSTFNNWVGGLGYIWQEECVDGFPCQKRRGW